MHSFSIEASESLILAVLGRDNDRLVQAFRDGANINYVSAKSMAPATPLCAASGNIGLMRALLEAGANPNTRDPRKGSPLELASCTDADLDQVLLLLSHGAQPNARDWQGWTPLMLAVPYQPIVELLVEHGADVSAADNEGWSVLMAAVRNGTNETVRFLIRLGADVQHRDEKGTDALTLARRLGRRDIVEVLEMHRKDLMISTSRLSASLIDAYQEIHNLASRIMAEKWRKSPPVEIEIALGYAAFFAWLWGGENLSEDPCHYDHPSNSTRLISLLVVSLTTERMELVHRIRALKSGFDPTSEVNLAQKKPTQDSSGVGRVPNALRNLILQKTRR